jgi:hypothetical protein
MPTYDRKYFTLFIDDAWMHADLLIKDFSNLKELIHDLTEILRETNIKRVNREKLKEILADKIQGERLRIAEGILPEPSHPAFYELLIDLNEKPRPLQKMDGGVDLKELFIPNLVKKNRPIMRKIPASPGKAGIDIRGNKIAPVEKKISTFQPSQDLKPSETDPNILVADKAGLVIVEDKAIKINDILDVRRDVDYGTGNIDFPGKVIIHGDVKSGFRVKATGDIEIHGMVEDASIISDGNVTVKKGFAGNGEGFIKAGGNVQISYGLNQTIQCENLTFHKELINCKVYANNAVISRRGLIIGGEIKAQYKVEVRQIGHEEATKAIISVGSRKDLIQRKLELENKVKELNEEYKKIKETLYELFRKKMKKALSHEEEELLEQLEVKKKVIPEEVQRLEKNLTELNQAFEKIRNANITVFGDIFPGNLIELFSEKLDPRKHLRNVIIRFENDELIITKL